MVRFQFFDAEGGHVNSGMREFANVLGGQPGGSFQAFLKREFEESRPELLHDLPVILSAQSKGQVFIIFVELTLGLGTMAARSGFQNLAKIRDQSGAHLPPPELRSRARLSNRGMT
jgi:hypothetical protein